MLKISSRCLCCPLKRRHTHSSLDEVPYIVYNPDCNDEYLHDDIFQAKRPLSASSGRNANDIQLNGLTNVRETKPMPHYASPLQRTARVAPSSASSVSASVRSDASSSISPASYLFGSRQASKLSRHE
jgi:hypothetical protein